MSVFSGIARQLRDVWARLTNRQRLLITGAAFAVMIALILWTNVFGARAQYVPLFSQLEPEDAAAIAAKLDEAGTPYKPSADGSSILVDAKDVYQIRWEMAQAGLPKGGVVGYEIFDKTAIGATEFERRVNYLRALEGELTRTIEAFDAVSNARVHVVLPEPALFAADQQPATAAVFLELKPGRALAPDQVRGIVNLVARSVEGLKSDQITIVDKSGNILTADLGDNEGSLANPVLTASRIETQRNFQKQLETSLQTLLTQVFGPGNVVARVTAELNWDEKTIDKRLFEPLENGEGVVRTLEELSETVSGTEAATGGTPGTSGNVPGYQGSGGGQGSSSSEKTQVAKTFEINEIQEHLTVAPGTVRRMSVAVVVNRDLTTKEQDAIEATVKSAIGFDEARNDLISVTGMAFNTDMAKTVQADIARQTRNENIRNYAIIPGISLLALFIFWRVLSAMRSRPEELAIPVSAYETASKVMAIPTSIEEMTPEDRDRAKIREQIEKLAKQKPESIANLIKTWLSED
ncbi:MAG: flagellar basal-body MS-ring/collar protein FliF [Chloroflexota bacterium]